MKNNYILRNESRQRRVVLSLGMWGSLLLALLTVGFAEQGMASGGGTFSEITSKANKIVDILKWLAYIVFVVGAAGAGYQLARRGPSAASETGFRVAAGAAIIAGAVSLASTFGFDAAMLP